MCSCGGRRVFISPATATAKNQMSNLQTLDWLQATHELLKETPAKTFSIKCEAKSLQDTISRMWLMESVIKQDEK